jgi:hypothetical protein
LEILHQLAYRSLNLLDFYLIRIELVLKLSRVPASTQKNSWDAKNQEQIKTQY